MNEITEESDATPDEAYELGWLAAMDEAEKIIETMNANLAKAWEEGYWAANDDWDKNLEHGMWSDNPYRDK